MVSEIIDEYDEYMSTSTQIQLREYYSIIYKSVEDSDGVHVEDISFQSRERSGYVDIQPQVEIDTRGVPTEAFKQLENRLEEHATEGTYSTSELEEHNEGNPKSIIQVEDKALRGRKLMLKLTHFSVDTDSGRGTTVTQQ